MMLQVPVTVGPYGPHRFTLGTPKSCDLSDDVAGFQSNFGSQGGQTAQMQIDRTVADIASAR